MKKILSILALVLCSTFSFSQVNVGAKVGLNYANFSDLESPALNFTTQAILAHHIGAIAEFDLGERFALTTEVLYSVKGSETRLLTIFPVFQTFANSYISVPIAAKFKLGKFGILGGLEPSFLISERIKFGTDAWQPANGLSNTLDFSLIGGLDFRFNKWYIAVRYIHGLADALAINFTDENGQPLGEGSSTNRVFQFSAGYFFLD